MLRMAFNRKSILWSGAAVLAASAHFGLALACYQHLSDDDYYAPPQAIMIAFAEDITQPDIVDDAQEIANATPELAEDLQPEEPQQIAQTSLPDVHDLTTESIKKTEPEKPQTTHKKHVEKPERVKHKTVKPAKPTKTDNAQKSAVRQISTVTSSSYAATHTSLSAASQGISPARWLAKVQTHLERQKNYLMKQRNSRESGVARLEFVVSEDGSIRSMRLTGTTGSAELDQLALNVLKRASPLPKPPSDRAGKRMSVPLVFR